MENISLSQIPLTSIEGATLTDKPLCSVLEFQATIWFINLHGTIEGILGGLGSSKPAAPSPHDRSSGALQFRPPIHPEGEVAAQLKGIGNSAQRHLRPQQTAG
jgi:hypothetical protein